jgi:hypothetical protein
VEQVRSIDSASDHARKSPANYKYYGSKRQERQEILQELKNPSEGTNDPHTRRTLPWRPWHLGVENDTQPLQSHTVSAMR